MLCLVCVIFILSANIGVVYALENEKLEFNYNGRVFTYNLTENIKSSSVFDIDYEINKYDRFSSHEDRKILLKKMLSIGIDKSIAIEYLFPNITNLISKIEKNIYIQPQNASMKINTNSEKVFHIKNEVVGIILDKDKLLDTICNHYLSDKNLNFNIPIKKISPKILSSDFSRNTHLRADFSTNISSSSSDRKHNIKNALNSLNNVEILPGNTFSFNQIVGRRTAENGYREAKIIVNNEFVDGLGGGVCQVSTTLYNTALLSGMEIIEANKHSKQISYVKYGFDAMVNFGSSDLKFRNNTSEKITIITNYSQDTARIRIFGASLDNVQYKLKNNIINLTEPEEEILYDKKQEYLDKVVYDDEFFYLNRGNIGMEVHSYREKYVNGMLSETQLLRKDKYTVQNTVKIYGTKKRTDSSVHFSKPFHSLDI